MSMIIFEIKWFFSQNWLTLLFVLLLVFIGLFLFSIMRGYEPPPEQIKIEIEGTIAGIRNTGAWNVNDTEIKFADGSIFLLSYHTVQHYKLKHGQKIKITYSSYKGRVIEINDCKEIEGAK